MGLRPLLPGEGELNSASRPHEPSLTTCLVVLLLVIVFFGAIRFRLRNMPLERDEGEYAYAGQMMLEGIPPYALAYNMKLPGIYAAYAAVMTVFGQTPAGIHLGLLLLNAATTTLIFFLTARLFGRMAGCVAGCSYALLTTSASVMGFEAHATNFVVLPAVVAILLLLRATEFERGWLIFLSGLFFGLAFLMKQHGMFFMLFGLIYVLWSARQKGSLPRVVKEGAFFSLGSVVPYLATCWLMFHYGVFRQFWFWTFEYAGEYSKMGLRRAIRAFLENSIHVAAPAILIWIIAAVGLAAAVWSARLRSRRFFLVALLVCSFLAICPGVYFRPHYYILLLPVVAMLAGVGVSFATEAMSGRSRSVAAMPLVIFVLCFAFCVGWQRTIYFRMSPVEAIRAIYDANGFIPAVAVADYVREHSPTDAKIAVLGSEPEIYFYSHRHSATGYLYMYSLIVHQKYTARMRDEMLEELEANRPLYVIYVDVWDDWGPEGGGPELEEFLPRLREFMSRYYEDADGPRYVWSGEKYRPGETRQIVVMRRKAGL